MSSVSMNFIGSVKFNDSICKILNIFHIGHYSSGSLNVFGDIRLGEANGERD